MLLLVYLIERICLHRDSYNRDARITHYSNKDNTFPVSSIFVNQLYNQHSNYDDHNKSVMYIKRVPHTLHILLSSFLLFILFLQYTFGSLYNKGIPEIIIISSFMRE